MRLACTLDLSASPHLDPLVFSSFLSSHGVKHTFEQKESLCDFWVYDEEHLNLAKQLFEQYKQDPCIALNIPAKKALDSFSQMKKVKARKRAVISFWLILSCIGLFFWSQVDRKKELPPKVPGVIFAPYFSPVEKALIYDYPTYFQLRDEVLPIYEKDPAASQALIKKIRNTSVWMGIYEQLIAKFKHQATLYDSSFKDFGEKIFSGQIWRIFTPALLHVDFLHIFFNLLWFFILSGQVETKLGIPKYLLLVGSIAAVSNTAQYIVTGPFFMGLSGVICGLAAFIWVRQKKAPWEGYLLHRLTLIFLACFVLGMLGLQIVLFLAQILGFFTLPIEIANTAHITGALVGALFGSFKSMSYHAKH